MAEGFARHLLGNLLDVFSAGIEARGLDPYAVEVMKEIGIDISGQRSKKISELGNTEFDYVITLCDSAQKNCPFFPAKYGMIHKGFDDPVNLVSGEIDKQEILKHYRNIRDQIRKYVEILPVVLRKNTSNPTSDTK
jgi:arsenate reductase